MIWREAMKLKSLIEAGEPERLATGFQFTEGPVWMADGYLLFSDIPANIMYKWTPESGAEVWREPSGNSNGLTRNSDDLLLACEHGNRRVSRTNPAGTVETIAGAYQGKRLNSPNDVVVKSDGSVYFTDPPYGLTTLGPDEGQELDFHGVYRLSPDGQTLTLLADDYDCPNGLCFSPDESILCGNDTARMLRSRF